MSQITDGYREYIDQLRAEVNRLEEENAILRDQSKRLAARVERLMIELQDERRKP